MYGLTSIKLPAVCDQRLLQHVSQVHGNFVHKDIKIVFELSKIKILFEMFHDFTP